MNINDFFEIYRPFDSNLDFHLSKIKIVEDFLIKYNLPKDLFFKNKENIYIKKDLEQYCSSYNSSSNSIVYVKEDEITHELFHMASSNRKNKATGITKYINGKKVNIGLDEGITDMYASFVDKNSSCNNIFEKICAQILLNTFGIQIFYGYFNNSYDEFINSFDNNIREKIEDLLKLLDEYHKLIFEELEKNILNSHSIMYRIIVNFFKLYEDLNLDKKELAKLIKELFADIPDDYRITLGVDKINLDELSIDFGM